MPEDTIFVLTGDARRIPFAVRKLRQNPKTNMYIIGVGGDGSGINMPARVKIESKSKSTYQNALAIKKISEKQGLDRIVLITTVDHFNRAKYLIKGEMPDVEIAPCPVPLTNMSLDKQLERWLTEYIKYIGTLIGIKES